MKKIISLALVAIMVFSLSVVAFAAKLGDVNGDGSVKASDALFILQSVVGDKTLTAKQKKIADCNKDGKVSAMDARMILQMVVGKIPLEELPEEEEEEKDGEKEIHSFTLSADPEERERLKMTFLGGELGGGVVLLNQEQLEDLLDSLSFDEFNKYVGIVRDCELNGKSYKKKSHYQAILDMAAKDRKVGT